MSREVIAQVASLIGPPEHWCRGAMARDAKGYPTNPLRAEKWDAIGAAYKVTGTRLEDGNFPQRLGSALAGMQLASVSLHKMSLEAVNDKLGHAHVLEVLRLAWRQARTDAEIEGAR